MSLTSSACFGGMLFGWGKRILLEESFMANIKDIGTIGGIIVMPTFMR